MDRTPSVPPSPASARTVLIFTANAGGGHLAAAKAIERALITAGHRAVIVDGMSLVSPRLRWVQIDAYAWALAHLSWSYGIAFRVLGLAPVVYLNRTLIGRCWGSRLLECIELTKPEVIVSTFPTVTAGLGELVKHGRLHCPVFAMVTDFGVHPMWVSPFIDLHFVLETIRSDSRSGQVAALRS